MGWSLGVEGWPKGPGLGAGVLFWASLIEVGLLLIGDDGQMLQMKNPVAREQG